jgi:hypothetical protein
MTDAANSTANTKTRGLDDRGTRKTPVGELGNRGIGTRGIERGNPGVFIGQEEHDGKLYARYEAVRGTWVSSSLKERGYDRKYGSDSAYGAYAGVAVDSNLRPLKNPDRIDPGLQYLIPIEGNKPTQPSTPPRTTATPPGPQLSAPVTKQAKDGFSDTWHTPKKLAAKAATQAYPSFELDADRPPPDLDPREAVAFWLRMHSVEIEKAERRWHVSRIAIAGAIAWEALNNPQAASFKAVGPGKMHLVAEKGDIPWPDFIERTGRMPPLTDKQREEKLKESSVAIDYIGALMDIVSEDAAKRGWDIRGNAAILGQIYHAFSPLKWKKHIAAKPAASQWEVVPGTMGVWIPANRSFLEKAVGKSGIL